MKLWNASAATLSDRRFPLIRNERTVSCIHNERVPRPLSHFLHILGHINLELLEKLQIPLWKSGGESHHHFQKWLLQVTIVTYTDLYLTSMNVKLFYEDTLYMAVTDLLNYSVAEKDNKNK